MTRNIAPFAILILYCSASTFAQELEERAIQVLKSSCSFCHGDGEETHGNLENILDFEYLESEGLIDIESPEKSRILERMKDTANPMPPSDAPSDQVRSPSKEDIQIIEKWLVDRAGKSKKPAANSDRAKTGVQQAFDEAAVHRLVRLFLEQQPRSSAKNFRFISFANIQTLKQQDSLIAKRLRDTPDYLIPAAISKAINSLHWSTEIVEPIDIQGLGVVFAIPMNRLRTRLDRPWSDDQWQLLSRRYPYALKLGLSEDYLKNVELTDDSVPVIRGDWFLVNALKPPLYHDLLQLPNNTKELETFLGVDVEANILNGSALRTGFINSGISKNANRLAERHESKFGYYWKSYDFLPGAPRGNLIQLPTGPNFEKNPFPDTAFRHDGGEMLFSLPNGLQAFFLASADGRRLDAGPPELVSDDSRVSGIPLIVNGVSCIACHAQGIYPLTRDEILKQTQVAGDVRKFVQLLHRDSEAVQKLDQERFLQSIRKTISPYVTREQQEQLKTQSIPEPIKVLASHYVNANLKLVDVAAELGVREDLLKDKITHDPVLGKLGLTPLLENKSIKRDDWEKTSEGNSKFQLVARQLKIGTPIIVVNADQTAP